MAYNQAVSSDDLTSKDFVPRGHKASSPFSTTLFLGLRVLDCFFQYGILSQAYGGGIIKFFGGNLISASPNLQPGLAPLDTLNLTPYRLILLSMICTTTAKHIWYVTCVGEEAWTVPGAISIGAFNTFWNTLNNLLFLCTATSAASAVGGETLANPRLLIGVTLFALGIGSEWQCEMHRKAFKLDPRNKGKAFKAGLFAVVRHPNYAGYSLWRAASALATSGLVSAALTGAFFLYDFSSRAIPALDEYCSKRYGNQWVDYKRKTPFTLIPFFL